MRSRLLASACTGATLLATGLLVILLGDVVWRGIPALSFDFVCQAPRDAGRAGGIGPILVATAITVLIALGAALPLAVAAAAYLCEFTRQSERWHRLVSAGLDLLAAMPSIGFGLFGNAFFGRFLGLGYSLLGGGLTLACMILPLCIRSLEIGFRSVPIEARWAAAALGMSETATLRRVVWPGIRPALGVGALLGLTRALAETAALVFTSGLVDRWPESWLDSGRVLSVHILELAMNVPGGTTNAAGTALALLGITLGIELGGRCLLGRDRSHRSRSR